MAARQNAVPAVQPYLNAFLFDPNQPDALQEKISGVLVPASLGNAVEKIDLTYISKQWQKLSKRHVSERGSHYFGKITIGVCLLLYPRLHRQEF
jgi:hypothetical protein